MVAYVGGFYFSTRASFPTLPPTPRPLSRWVSSNPASTRQYHKRERVRQLPPSVEPPHVHPVEHVPEGVPSSLFTFRPGPLRWPPRAEPDEDRKEESENDVGDGVDSPPLQAGLVEEADLSGVSELLLEETEIANQLKRLEKLRVSFVERSLRIEGEAKRAREGAEEMGARGERENPEARKDAVASQLTVERLQRKLMEAEEDSEKNWEQRVQPGTNRSFTNRPWPTGAYADNHHRVDHEAQAFPQGVVLADGEFSQLETVLLGGPLEMTNKYLNALAYFEVSNALKARCGDRLERGGFSLTSDTVLLAVTHTAGAQTTGGRDIAAVVELCLRQPDGSVPSNWPFRAPWRPKKPQPVWQPYMCNLAVAKEYRGRGFGKQLVRLCEHMAKNHWGYERMYLHVDLDDPAATGLYNSLGYESIPQYDTPKWMRKLFDMHTIRYMVKDFKKRGRD